MRPSWRSGIASEYIAAVVSWFASRTTIYIAALSSAIPHAMSCKLSGKLEAKYLKARSLLPTMLCGSRLTYFHLHVSASSKKKLLNHLIWKIVLRHTAVHLWVCEWRNLTLQLSLQEQYNANYFLQVGIEIKAIYLESDVVPVLYIFFSFYKLLFNLPC